MGRILCINRLEFYSLVFQERIKMGARFEISSKISLSCGQADTEREVFLFFVGCKNVSLVEVELCYISFFILFFVSY